MRVEVYYNIHKQTFSVRALEGEYKGKVIKHTQLVQLTNAKFVVQPGGRRRVLDENRKNVHAFVRGELYDTTGQKDYGVDFCDMTEVYYNPYMFDSFVNRKTSKAVESAPYVYMCFKKVYAHEVKYV